MVKNFENDFKSKQVEVDILAESQPFYRDKDKICQVMINILSNALKYTCPGGLLQLKVTADFDKIIFSAKDTGLGISKEDLPFIFERFYRADKARNRGTGGTGIGLTISKVLIEAHHGTITIDSEMNQWTEIVIKLPLKFT